jgi:hypothetical protein
MGQVEREGSMLQNHLLRVTLVAWDETNFVCFHTNILAISIFASQES